MTTTYVVDVVVAPPALIEADTVLAQGPAGPPGLTGPPGLPGPGVAAGGTTGQVLTKDSATDYDTSWQNAVTTPLAHHATHEPGGADAIAALDAGVLTTGTLPNARLNADTAIATSVAVGTNPAQSGAIRLANRAGIVWRKADNTADISSLTSYDDEFTLYGLKSVRWRAASDPDVIYQYATLWPAVDAVVDLGFSTIQWRNLYLSGAANAQTVQLREVAFASLPAGQPVGTLANVSDSNTATIGGTVAGGGTNHVLARYNGTAWKVESSPSSTVQMDSLAITNANGTGSLSVTATNFLHCVGAGGVTFDTGASPTIRWFVSSAGHLNPWTNTAVDLGNGSQRVRVAYIQTVNASSTLQLAELAFASLPAGQPVGTLANVSDSNTATIGGTVAGGGTNHVLARYNGTAWKVVA